MSPPSDAGDSAPARPASARVVTPGFHARVYAVVRCVPPGSVTTYGDVATVLGSPRVARHVGWALAGLDESTHGDVPWHRVINAKGTISFKGQTLRASAQRQRLEAEGVTFDDRGRLDLAARRFDYADVLDSGVLKLADP